MNDNLNNLIKKNSIYILGQKLITPILNILITVYIIRGISVEGFGTYNILFALMGYIGIFSSLGLPHIFQRFIPEYHSKNEVTKLKLLVRRGLFWRLVIIIIIILIIILLSDEVGKLLKIENFVTYFCIFSLGIIFHLEAGQLSIALTSLFLHKYFVLSEIGYTLVRFGILYYLVKLRLELKGLLIAEMLCFGVLLLLQIYYYHRNFSKNHPIKNKIALNLKRMLRYGGFNYFNDMGTKILETSTDLLIISAFLGVKMAALYAFADHVIKLLSKGMPHILLMDVLRPAFFIKYVQNPDKKELEKMFNLLIKLVAFFSFPLMMNILILGDKMIVYIFDPRYLNALYVLWIVAGFTIINYFQFPLRLVLQATERVEIDFFSKIFSIYNLVADLLVVKPFGIMGVAMVTGSAILFQSLFIYFFIQRHVSLSIELRSIGRMMVNSLLMAGLLFFLRGLVVNFYLLILTVFIGGLIYLLISYLNKSFSNSERQIVNGILPRPIFSF